MASVWKGALSFGLVNIPVRLHPAVRSGKGEIHFHELHKADLAPIRHERVCTADGKTVEWSDIVKGYEYAKGKYVALTQQELESAALDSSEAFEIQDFVHQDEIDPRYFDTPYYLVPEKVAERAYVVLREAMRTTGMVGVGTFTLRQHEQLSSVRTIGPALVLERMRFAGQLVPEDDFDFPSATKAQSKELKIAEQLIESLAAKFEPSKYKDTYRANIERLIRAKLKGKPIEVERPPKRKETPVIDLVSRLQESLAQQKQHGGRSRRGRRPA